MAAPSDNRVIPETHVDRPVSRVQLPFRVIPGRVRQVEYEQLVGMPDRSFRRVPMHVPIEDSPYGNQIGLKVVEMMEIYFAVETQVNGLLAKVDQLTTDNVLQQREIEKLTNQLAEARRSSQKAKG